MSDDKMDDDMSAEEKYDEFDDEVEPGVFFLSPRTTKNAPWIQPGTYMLQYLSRSVLGRPSRPNLIHGTIPVSRFNKPPK